METLADLFDRIVHRLAERSARLRQEEQKALAETRADLQELDKLAAAASDALHAGDARVDAATPQPAPAPH